MKVVICTKYGPPEVLKLQEVEKPVPKFNEVLIRNHATVVGPSECAARTGNPLMIRFVTGLTKPKKTIPGAEFAGEVEAVGNNVQLFKEGDQVFGSSVTNVGTYTEYITLPEDSAMVTKPTNITFGEAAAVCDGAITAMYFLRKGDIQNTKNILINGASGSLGTAAVQLAKHFGAEVTGVCSTKNLELVKSLGADKVIDYTREDFTRIGDTYDIIWDMFGKNSFSQCKDSLKQRGRYITTAPTPSSLLQMVWTSRFGNKKVIWGPSALLAAGEKIKDLKFLSELIEVGKLKTVIDRSYPIEQIAEAHRYVETGHKIGNVVINIGDIKKEKGLTKQRAL
jgi:NADPH:quinone reductase-like Zn-dependent oxidoreductase